MQLWLSFVDNSFPKARRLRKRADFLAVQRGGKTQHGRYFVVVYEKNGQGRLGITVSKKVGNAVIRNRVKRLVRNFVRLAPGGKSWSPDTVDVVIIARKNTASATAQVLWADLERCAESLWPNRASL